MTDALSALHALAQTPEVADASARAREAFTRLRWHQALRRQIPAAAAESRVRGAWASAELDGARSEMSVIRDVMRGARVRSAQPDPAERVIHGAIDATALTEQMTGVVSQAPAQALASLHLAAASQICRADQLGRPRREPCQELLDLGAAPPDGELMPRLTGVHQLMRAATEGQVPALVLCAVVHAELAVLRPFVAGNGLVARGVERALWQTTGLDPTGVAVPEIGHGHQGVGAYVTALSAYAHGSSQGVAAWLVHCGTVAEVAAAEGIKIADAVLAGYLTSPEPPLPVDQEEGPPLGLP